MHLKNLIAVFLLASLIACSWGNASPPRSSPEQLPHVDVSSEPPTPLPPQPTATSTPLPPPPRLLTVCLGREPRSLFFYQAISNAERGVLSAIYDGPFDIHDFTVQPVILQKMPSLADGDVLLQQVQVQPGDLIADASGNLTALEEGVLYRPSGCSQQTCAQVYAGDQPVQMDQLIVRFHLLPGLLWSDGAPLSAADSVYSFQVASFLYPVGLPEQVSRTQAYQAVDETTVEWTGFPGYQDGSYHTKFFPPLPRHARGQIPLAELPQNELASRTPLGWGAYSITEWVEGDHISLQRNPFYFRAAEGLPHFDHLVFRFVSNGDEALDALLAGECDLVDQSAPLESQLAYLLDLQSQGRISLVFQPASAWEMIAFGIRPLVTGQISFFGSPEVRQAVAQCIDRQALVASLASGQMMVADAYLPPQHPLYNAAIAQYDYDPQAAATLLEAAGWLDLDGDPATPRLAQGVPGIPDGTQFIVEYLVSPEAERQAVAQAVQSGLAGCGIQVNILTQDASQYLAAGPEGAVFGRHFEMAQFALATAVEPPCSLYLTNEIPGPYPDYPRAWGGANASGYSSAAYDQACTDALYSLPDLPQHAQAHAQAQAIFAEDLPVLPLFWHISVVVGRPDLCGVPSAVQVESLLSDLEVLDYGEGCP